MSDRPSIAIIGPGRVGTVLGVLAARAGYRVAGVGGRDEEKARAAAARIGPDVPAGRCEDIAPRGQLVLLTVSDDAIEPLGRSLAEAGAFARGAVVAHCCGALSSEVLAPARRRCGAAVASMHPLQTFPSVQAGLERFAGTYCFCEGDDKAVAVLEDLARAVGGRPVRIRPEAKLLYHAAAVTACNYLTALLDAALALAERAGVAREEALPALAPLVRSTLANVLAAGPADALTGPIARGDEALVARQHRAVRAADSGLGDLYRALGLWTVGLAERKGSIGGEQARRLRAILSGG